MILGICGDLRAGKTTAALHLANDYDGWNRHRFAGPLKKMLMCLGLTIEQVDGNLKEVPDTKVLGGVTPRKAMQLLGTEFGRESIHENIWLDAWIATMPDDNVVCDDVRFPNEAEAIRGRGGCLIRIERPTNDNFERSHASEGQDLGPYHYTIQNDGTIPELYARVNECLENFRANP